MKENIPMDDEKTLKRSVLTVSAFAAFLTPFLGSAINLALPAIGKDFNATALELGWIVSSFILAAAIFLLPFGRLADIIGRKKIFTWGISLFTISTFLIIFSWNIQSLIIFRIMQGIASAMIFGTSLAIITSVFGPGERGRARLIADPRNGVRKAAKAETVRTDLLSVLSSTGGIFSFIGPYSLFFVSIMIVTGPSL